MGGEEQVRSIRLAEGHCCCIGQENAFPCLFCKVWYNKFLTKKRQISKKHRGSIGDRLGQIHCPISIDGDAIRKNDRRIGPEKGGTLWRNLSPAWA